MDVKVLARCKSHSHSYTLFSNGVLRYLNYNGRMEYGVLTKNNRVVSQVDDERFVEIFNIHGTSFYYQTEVYQYSMIWCVREKGKVIHIESDGTYGIGIGH